MAFHSTEKMNEVESISAFCDGAKKAVSAAMELARETENPIWETIARTLDDLRKSGYQLAHMKMMSKSDLNAAIDLKLRAPQPH